MKKLLTIIPFWVFTAAFGQSVMKIDTIYVKVLYLGSTPYKLTGATNLYGDAAIKNNNTVAVWSGVDWLGANHPFVLQLRSDLDKVIADAAKLKADNTALKTENTKLKNDILINRSNILEHEQELSRLQNDSTTLYIINSGTIAKPIWKLTTVKPK